MNYTHFIGIDVSKEWFDVALHNAKQAKPERFPNSGEGFADFAGRFAAELPEALVVLESTGGYEAALIDFLLACMPELGTFTRRQAASLAGVALYTKDSGKTQGCRATRGGKVNVKRALFMAAMAARRFNPNLREFFGRLVQNGKKRMVALIAVMRKPITILNAKLRDYAHV